MFAGDIPYSTGQPNTPLDTPLESYSSFTRSIPPTNPLTQSLPLLTNLVEKGVSKAGDTLGKVPGVNYGVSFFADYRKFMDRGNVIDLAVAVVIGMFTFFPFQLSCPAMYLSGGCLYVVHFNYPPTNRITKRGRKTPSQSPLFSIANHNLFKRLTNCQLLPVCLPNQLLGAAFTAVSEPLHKRLLRTLTEKLYQTSSLEGGLLLQRKRKGEKDQKTARSSDFGFSFVHLSPSSFFAHLHTPASFLLSCSSSHSSCSFSGDFCFAHAWLVQTKQHFRGRTGCRKIGEKEHGMKGKERKGMELSFQQSPLGGRRHANKQTNGWKWNHPFTFTQTQG